MTRYSKLEEMWFCGLPFKLAYSWLIAVAIRSVVLALLLSVLPAALTAPTEVWLKYGTVTGGSGTMADPKVVASSTVFDSYMNGQPADTTIHLMAGTFHTAQGLTLKTGWKIRGAGMDVTVIQLDTLPSPPPTTYCFTVVGAPPGVYRNDGAEVSDLTVDCNLQNQPTQACVTAIRLQGSDTKISRAKAINWGSMNTIECFIMSISSHYAAAGMGRETNCVIEDCVIGAPAATMDAFAQGATAFSVFGGILDAGPYNETPGDGWIAGGEVRHCRIENISVGGPGQPAYFNGIGAAAVYGFKAVDNTCINVANGSGSFCLGMGCGSIYDCILQNNVFLNVQNGIYFKASDSCVANKFRRDNIQVLDNFITVKDGGIGLAFAGYASEQNPGGPYLTNLVVRSNRVLPEGLLPLYYAAGVFFSDKTIVEDNVLDANGGPELTYDINTSFASLANNKTSAGADPKLGFNALPQDEADQHIVFQPGSAGWYRLLDPNTPQFSSSNVRIRRDIDGGDNSVNDIEFNYEVTGYVGDPNALGEVNLLQYLNLGAQGVTKVRIGNNGIGLVSLDIYVASAPVGRPITIDTRGGKGHWFLNPPTHRDDNDVPQTSKILLLGPGLRTSGQLYAGNGNGNPNTQLTDVAGKINTAALNIVDMAHGGTSAGDAATALANLSGGSLISSGGNIGVGKTPAAGNKLDVSGNINVAPNGSISLANGNVSVYGNVNALNFSGNLSASQLNSGLVPDLRLDSIVARTDRTQTFTAVQTFSPASGAPFAVGNSTKVSSLNADLLDGMDSSAFAPSSGSGNYVAKSGDTMTGTLNLPANGLIVGTSQLLVSGGKVGIGTASPGNALQVVGTVQATSFSGNGSALTSVDAATLNGQGSSAFVKAFKSGADQQSTTTTLADASGLSFSGSANTDYAFEFFVIFQISTATKGIKLAVNGPTGATLTYIVMPQLANTANGTANLQEQTFTTADGTIITASIDTANVNRIALIKGAVSVGSTAGNVTVRFANGASGSYTTTVKKASWGTYL